MWNKILSLIPAYRRVCQELRRMSDLKIHQDDEVRTLRARIDDLNTRLVEALEDGRRSRELVANWLAQRMFGLSIYDTATPKLPEGDDTPAVVGKHKVQGRDIVRQAEAEFRAAMLERPK